MQIFVSILISALMVLGTVYHTDQKTSELQKMSESSLGASQSISSLVSGTTLDDADLIPYVDNSGTPTTKRITWGNATSSLKTLYDTLYSPIFSTSAGLASLLSDETGSGGGFVRATAPTITTPSLTTPTLDLAGTDATGDLYYNGGSGVMTRLGIGNENQILGVLSGVPGFFSTTSSALGILPSQSGNGAKFLTTDGASLSWGAGSGSADFVSTTSSGTWTKPSNVHASSTVFVECWGGGGGGGSRSGASSGGGGGGAYVAKMFRASDLTSTVAVTIGQGGTATNVGGNTTFGAYLTAYGGGGGVSGNTGAGGGGGILSAGSSGSGANGGAGGGPAGSAGGAGAGTANSGFGGAGGAGANSGGDSGWGGAGGSSGDGGSAGNSVYGGGGGGGTNGTSGSDSGGTSVFGGAGGAGNHSGVGSNGSTPGGGGGGGTTGGTGGNGKCNILTKN